MHLIDTPTSVQGLFVDKNPALNIPGTTADASWFNAVQNEICNVILATTMTLNKESNVQLVTAVNALAKDAVAKQVISDYSESVSENLRRISTPFPMVAGFFLDVSLSVSVPLGGSGNAVIKLYDCTTSELSFVADLMTVELVDDGYVYKRILEKMSNSLPQGQYCLAVDTTGATVPAGFTISVNGIVSKN